MTEISSAINNLKAQKALRDEEGVWDLAILLDKTGISSENLANFDLIQKLARSQNIHCQKNWKQPPDDIHTICIVGHNGQHLQKNVSLWGENGWLRGRYLILFACGNRGEASINPGELFDERGWGVIGSTMFTHQIELPIVVLLLKNLLADVESP